MDLLTYLLTYNGRARYRAEAESSEEWQTLRVVPNDSSSMTIYRLRPHRTYQFLVMARDRFGRQRFSPAVSATTLRTSLFVYIRAAL